MPVRRVCCGAVATGVVWGLAALPAGAALRNISAFNSPPIETFDEYHATNAVPRLSVLNGAGTVTNRTEGGSIKLEFSSSLAGDLVTPISGMMMGQLGIADWEFAHPVRRFGALIENNSGMDGGTAYFYDATDNLIGTLLVVAPVKAQRWTWNGWESDTPFKRLRVVGNGLINGFLWYENVRVSDVPCTPTLVAFAGIGAACARRRR